MTIVHDILPQMPGLGQPQRQFLATLFVPILGRRGRVTFRTLSRSCASSERTIARQCRAPLAWPDCPQRVLRTALDPRAALLSAHAASFIPKRGQQTCGLGHFFNGGARRAARGLEMATRAVGEVTRRCALTLARAQTPPGEDTRQAARADTRGACDAPQLCAHRPRWPPGVRDHGVDGDEAQQPSREAVVRLDLHAITKRRRAADCWVRYTGPPPQRRGARRQYAGEGTFPAVSRVEDRGPRHDEPPLHLYTAVVCHTTLQRRVRLVGLLHRQDPAKPRFSVLGSSEPELQGHTLRELYAARFQSAFLLRDSKQCTGRLDGQARAAAA